MSEKELEELRQYNLEYLEALDNENLYDEDYTSTVELKYAKKEIERLNNIIDKAIHYINLNQDSKSLCLNYGQLKALRGILRQDEFYLKLFEEQLKELKGSDE